MALGIVSIARLSIVVWYGLTMLTIVNLCRIVDMSGICVVAGAIVVARCMQFQSLISSHWQIGSHVWCFVVCCFDKLLCVYDSCVSVVNRIVSWMLIWATLVWDACSLTFRWIETPTFHWFHKQWSSVWMLPEKWVSIIRNDPKDRCSWHRHTFDASLYSFQSLLSEFLLSDAVFPNNFLSSDHCLRCTFHCQLWSQYNRCRCFQRFTRDLWQTFVDCTLNCLSSHLFGEQYRFTAVCLI